MVSLPKLASIFDGAGDHWLRPSECLAPVKPNLNRSAGSSNDFVELGSGKNVADGPFKNDC